MRIQYHKLTLVDFIAHIGGTHYFKTDRLIQEVIRNRFKDSTVLTIAHRLNTIMDYDKVLVMEQGRVVEFDKPEILLQHKNGFFARPCSITNTLS